MSIVERIKKWYRGNEVVPVRPNDPNSSLVFISLGHYEQPFLAKVLSAIGRFWIAHWKWIMTAIIFPLLLAVCHHYFGPAAHHSSSIPP